MKDLSRRKKGLFISVAIFLSLCVSLLIAEMYIRLTKEYVTPRTLGEKSPQYVPVLFARHAFPLTKQHIKARGWRINEKGYRGKDFSRVKKGGTTRILIYGGSAVFDTNMTYGNDWPSRIERLLKEKGLHQVEVINAGIPGHASFDSFGRFFAEGHIFEPDVVILDNAWNDIKYFPDTVPLLRAIRPLDPERDFRIRYVNALDEVLCEVSQLYVRIRYVYFNYRWKRKIGPEGSIPDNRQNRQITQLALNQYRINLEAFVNLARDIDAVAILITQPRLVSRTSTLADRKRIAYNYQGMSHDTLVRAFEATDEIAFSVARKKRIKVIDASGRMTGNRDYFSDHVHLTAAGSEELARIVAEHLVAHQLQQASESRPQ